MRSIARRLADDRPAHYDHPMPPLRRLFPLFAILAVLSAGGCAVAQSTRVPLSYDAPGTASVGLLDWRGGLVLSGDEDWFGGLSALDISDDGGTLTAVSDRARWFRFALERDAHGFLTGVRRVGSAPLIDVSGGPFRRRSDRDSESVARLPDGSYVVAFEQRHRLLRYPAGEPPFARPPRWLTPPSGLRGAPDNGGLEALTPLADGRLFAVSEELILDDGTALGWVGDGSRWAPLRYRPAEDFHATGAALLPGGDVLVLERRLSIVGGFAARLVRVTPREIDAAAADTRRILEGSEVARLQAPLNVDNFEGITAHRAANGETLVYIVSDDNFFALQRTLLFCFALREAPPAGKPQG